MITNVDLREVVLDTETTGLDLSKHRIIEIGAVELINKKRTGRVFHRYINPERSVDIGAFAVHGISDEFLIDKPKFSSIVDDLMAFIENSILVIHNAAFDSKFLNKELAICNRSNLSRDSIIDTLALARSLYPGSPASLDALCQKFGVSLSDRDLHGALVDAELLSSVYIAMISSNSQSELALGEPPSTSSNNLNVVDGKSQVRNSIADKERKSIGILSDLSVEITSEEIQRHEVFLQNNIPNAIWNKFI